MLVTVKNNPMSLKIIAIGDIHGRKIWEDIVVKNDYDVVVFMGDYFDSKEGISAADQIANFKNILAFKKENPEKVKLLFGNHDFHYHYPIEWYTGYQVEGGYDIQEILKDAQPYLFKYKPIAFRFTPGENMSDTGDDVTQSPIWVRIPSLLNDMVEMHQVVGHTATPEIHNLIFDDRLVIMCIDTLGSSKQYLIFENGKFDTGIV